MESMAEKHCLQRDQLVAEQNEERRRYSEESPKVSHLVQADEDSTTEEDEEDDDENDEKVDVYDGDVRVRVRFGANGKVHKLAAVGNHTFEELIEGCREVNGVTSHQKNIYVQAGTRKNEEGDVNANACVGTVVPSDFDASNGKPKVWMLVQSTSSRKRKRTQ